LKKVILPTQPAFGALIGGDLSQISPRSLVSENYIPLTIVQVVCMIHVLPFWFKDDMQRFFTNLIKSSF